MVQTRGQLRKASNEAVGGPGREEPPAALEPETRAEPLFKAAKNSGASLQRLAGQLGKRAAAAVASLEARPAPLQWLALLLFLFAATTTLMQLALGRR